MKRRFSQISAALMTSMMLSLGCVSFAPLASADTPRCVATAEFRRVDFNMERSRVHTIFDIVGKRVENDDFGETRQYRTCAGNTRSYVTVDYDFHRPAQVWFKWMYIETPRTLQSDKCVTAGEFRRVRKGMAKARVHEIFDTVGRQARGGAGGYIQFYQVCQRPHRLVQIGYEGRIGRPDRVFGKEYVQNP